MSQTKSNSLWPENEIPCIWMDAGLVDWKLCDRQRDCDNCAFHAAIKNVNPSQNLPRAAALAGPTADPLQRLRNQRWDATAFYGNRYWYAEPLSRQKALIGLHEPAVQIMPTVRDVVLTDDADIKKDQVVGWLVTDNGIIRLKAPFDARIQKTNDALLADMGDRDNKAWLFAVESPALATELQSWQQGDKAERFLDTWQSRLLAIFSAEQQTWSPAVGETMQDGGLAVASLEQMFGAKRYLKILSDFFDQCTNLPAD